MPHDKPREGRNKCPYYNEDCEKCNGPKAQPQPSGEGWEKRFDDNWAAFDMDGESPRGIRQFAKDFIRSLVSEAEARARKEAGTEIKRIVKDSSLDIDQTLEKLLEYSSDLSAPSKE